MTKRRHSRISADVLYRVQIVEILVSQTADSVRVREMLFSRTGATGTQNFILVDK